MFPRVLRPLAGRGETFHGLRDHGETRQHVRGTEKTGAFSPLRDFLATQLRYPAARVTFHHGLLAAVFFVGAVACNGGKPEEAPPATPPAGAQKVDTETAAVITGRVLFEGTPPENPVRQLSADPACTRENPGGYVFESYVVTDGGLDNVFVYVKDGLGKYYFDIPTETVKLDQKGCRYTPHVAGARVGQPVEFINSDDTMHNVHALPDVNGEVNFGQHKKGMQNTQVFTAAEVMVPVKCDLHGWMNAYIGIVEHPFYAVTKEGGRFELKGLPPGTYTIEAWHEKSGTKTQQVTVGPKETRDVSFTFSAPAKAGRADAARVTFHHGLL